MEKPTKPYTVGQIYLLNYNEVSFLTLASIKAGMAMDLDDKSSPLSNPFPYTNSKGRRISLERYHNFFYSNLHNASNLEIYIGLSAIESALEQGTDVYLLTQRPIKHTHGQTIYNYFKQRLEQDDIQFKPVEDAGQEEV